LSSVLMGQWGFLMRRIKKHLRGQMLLKGI
jgi:hypothetical protein